MLNTSDILTSSPNNNKMKSFTTSTTTIILMAATLGLLALASCSPMQTTSRPATEEPTTTTCVIVQTTSGILHGTRQRLNYTLTATDSTHQDSNKSVLQFLAVPYAQAPVGSLRFKRPLELQKERALDHLDASRLGRTCPQHRHLARFISPLLDVDAAHQTSEDCLRLNIYVPSSIMDNDNSSANHLKPAKQVPVIVWIPGEGFDFADARQFDGSHLAQQSQAIVVSVQYRVGVLGFLSASQLGVRGNMGLYDQLMALRWVSDNVAAFGGDPRRVTLMGRFSGSMSVSALATAPKRELIRTRQGEPLFNQVALLSGVAVNDWIIDAGQQEEQQRLGSLKAMALERGYCQTNASDAQQLMECLQKMPVERLLEVAGYGWKLAVDDELIDRRGPIEAVRANRLADDIEAVLMGETAAEGMLCLYRHLLNGHQSEYARLIDENRLTAAHLDEMLRDDSLTYFNYPISENNPMQIALNAMLANDDDHENSSQLRERYIEACSNYMVKSHAQRFKRNLANSNQVAEHSLTGARKPVQVFHYELRYKPSFSLAPHYIRTAAHGDDIPLIFGLIHKRPTATNYNQADLLITQRMQSYIGDFVHGKHSKLRAQNPSIEATDKKQVIDNEQDISEARESPSTATGDEGETLVVVPTLASLLRQQVNARGQLVAVELDESDLRMANRRLPAKVNNNNNDELIISRSQRLIEVHRQPEDNLMWLGQNSRRAAQMASSRTIQEGRQEPLAVGQFAGESSLMTILMLSACILTLALMSLCFVASLIVVRCNYYNVAAATRCPSASFSLPTGAHKTRQAHCAPTTTTNSHANHHHHHHSSALKCGSPCNFCMDDDVAAAHQQADCLDSVLAGANGNLASKRDQPGFRNVFAKLRGHNSTPAAVTQPTPVCQPQQQQQQQSGRLQTPPPANTDHQMDN